MRDEGRGCVCVWVWVGERLVQCCPNQQEDGRVHTRQVPTPHRRGHRNACRLHQNLPEATREAVMIVFILAWLRGLLFVRWEKGVG